jgi:iron complex outermembrane receptor protein
MTVFDLRRPISRWRAMPRRSTGSLALSLALTAVLPAQAGAAEDLTVLSLEQLLEVRVVGAAKYEQKQGEVAAAVSVITRQEIRTFGWRTLDEALASLPGVTTTYDRKTIQLGTRGFGLPGDFNTRVLLMIDGNRVNDPTFDTGLVGASFPIDLDLVERIEYIPGPGGAVYGQNAMFGVVNVITRHGADLNGAEVAVSSQQPQAQHAARASWGQLLDNGVDVLMSVSGARSRGADRFYEYGASNVSGIAAGLDGGHGQQFLARIGRGPWGLEQVYAATRKDDPTASFFSDPLVPGQFAAGSVALTQLLYDDSFAAESLHVSARLFQGAEQYDITLSNGGTAYETRSRSQWRGGELRLLYTAVAGHKLMLGVELQDNPVVEQSLPVPVGRGDAVVIRTPGTRAGVYAQDEWRLADPLTATLGVRVDRSNVTGKSTSPRAALLWQAAPATTLKALYGQAHRAPNAFERNYEDGFSQIANPALAGETIDTLEVVADQRIGRDLTVRGSVYQWTMKDLVTAVQVGSNPFRPLAQYQSGQTVQARGVELSADKTWAAGDRLRGSVSHQDVHYADGTRPFNSPAWLGKLNLSSPLPFAGLRAGYELRYDSQRASLNGSTLGGYAVSNLVLTTDVLAKGLELSLGIYNLFDKRYAQPAAISNWQNALQQDGRAVLVKLSYRL